MKPSIWACAILVASALPSFAADGADQALIDRGAYLARAGDCVACHTWNGGADFAGGRPMVTPIGTIYSTNITPDPKTGIGTYSYDDFARAVRHGVAKDGHALYPAMPYPSYSRVTDADMHALYAYFMNGVAPVSRPNTPSGIPWVLSWRWPLTLWTAVFGKLEPFRPDPAHDSQWNRGAYLVEGLGHCGSCHTPRGIAVQETAMDADDGTAYLSGAEIEGWFAKSLRNGPDGLAGWSEDDIVRFLKTGRTSRSAVFANMAEVVDHSTQHLDDTDLAAIATYLKSLPPAHPGSAAPATAAGAGTLAALRNGDYGQAGAIPYVEFCATCHRADGGGVAEIFPALAGNSVVTTPDTASLIRIVLAGGQVPATAGQPHAFTMPALTGMSDGEIAATLTFIRSAWGNRAGPVAAGDVARVRGGLKTGG